MKIPGGEHSREPAGGSRTMPGILQELWGGLCDWKRVIEVTGRAGLCVQAVKDRLLLWERWVAAEEF